MTLTKTTSQGVKPGTCGTPLLWRSKRCTGSISRSKSHGGIRTSSDRYVTMLLVHFPAHCSGGRSVVSVFTLFQSLRPPTGYGGRLRCLY
jgi:hypothetical protein